MVRRLTLPLSPIALNRVSAIGYSFDLLEQALARGYPAIIVEAS